MKTIIVPTDFSPIATNAMHYAIDMAKSINASILLLHVYQVPVSFTDTPIVLVSIEDLRKGAEEQIAHLKTEVEHLTSGSLKVYTETRLGNVADELENLCNKINPFAVVMGTKGASGVERILFGSNTLTAIRHLTWPVSNALVESVLPYVGTLKGVTMTGGNLRHAKAVKPDLLVVYRDYRVEHPADFELLGGRGGARQYADRLMAVWTDADVLDVADSLEVMNEWKIPASWELSFINI